MLGKFTPMKGVQHMPSVLDICSGAGGEALGLENAGFSHAGVIEVDAIACRTLRQNRSM